MPYVTLTVNESNSNSNLNKRVKFLFNTSLSSSNMSANCSRTVEFELVLNFFFRIIQFESSYAEFEFKIISLINK